MIVGILAPFWDDLLSGAMLVSGSVAIEHHTDVKLGGGIQRFRSFFSRILREMIQLDEYVSIVWLSH